MAPKNNPNRFLGLPLPRLKRRRSPTRRGNLAQELKRRELARVTGRASFWRSQLFYKATRIVPTRFRWLLPWLRESLPGFGEDAETPTDSAAIDSDESLIAAAPITDNFLLPPLAAKTKLLGQKGRYRIEALVSVRGRGRVYQGRQIGNERAVAIREYLLPPQQFSPSEIRQRQSSFGNRGGLALADGRPERFRLLEPFDTIPDQKAPRCYLVDGTGQDLLPTLRTHLTQHGAWTAQQVWRFFDQALQTLESLHGQKFVLPVGTVCPGIVHGNLTLDSLLIESAYEPAFASDPQFLIYMTDLLLWEALFEPPDQAAANPTVADDLIAIGKIGYRLLTGDATPVETAANNPLVPENWPSGDRQLKHFAWRLLGVQTSFADAASARRALLRNWQVPTTTYEPRTAAVTTDAETASGLWRWLMILVLVGVLGGGLGWWLVRRSIAGARAADTTPQLCCLDEVAAVPRGAFTYASDRDGIGTYVFRQKNLVFPDSRIETELQTLYPQLELTFQPTATDEASILDVLNEEADFALSVLFGKSDAAVLPLPSNLQAKVVAYDAIAAFIPFSYELRSQGLTEGLNGQLTLEQLRQLYTGQILNWRELGGPDLPVKLYRPSEPDMIAIFEQRVLQNPVDIAAFRRLFDDSELTADEGANISPRRETLRTFEILRAVIRDFEESAIGSIGFGPLSQVFGQCAVYPLALKADTGPFVQTVVQDEGGHAIDPSIDLCEDKGNYHRNHTAIATGQYLLAYPLEVIYPYDNSRPPIGRKVAEILRSQESQQLLERAGLVPIELD
ncbi:MAG: substrate-binding domain-containing protein [Cyanobacteria bacterium J06639_16]